MKLLGRKLTICWSQWDNGEVVGKEVKQHQGSPSVVCGMRHN
jgi:hypothetical protein